MIFSVECLYAAWTKKLFSLSNIQFHTWFLRCLGGRYTSWTTETIWSSCFCIVDLLNFFFSKILANEFARKTVDLLVFVESEFLLFEMRDSTIYIEIKRDKKSGLRIASRVFCWRLAFSCSEYNLEDDVNLFQLRSWTSCNKYTQFPV